MSATAALLPEHRRQLEVESAIPADILVEEDIRSLPGSPGLPTPDAALRHPNSHKGQHFGRWGETDARGRPVDLGPGIWFGTRDAAGRLGGQYRPDRPRTALNGHAVKYETCRGTRPSFAVPRRCLEPLLRSKCDIYITEGYKKALAIAGAGGCAVSLAGVDSWTVKPDPNDPKSEPVDDFDAVAWHGRVVWIAYDSDAAIKDGVRYAERRLAKELESRRAVVVAIRIPQAADGSKRGVDDYIRDRLAAGVSREDALCELKAMALAELTRRSELRQVPAGSDGAETCRACPDKDAMIEAQAEELRTFAAADELVKRGPFSPDAAQVHKQLVTVARSARSRGEERTSLQRKDVARLALGDETNVKAVTRAYAAYRLYQDDPELAATLPYRLDWREKDGKTYVDLIPAPEDEPRSRSQAFRALCRLPKPDDRRRGPNEDGRRHRPGACPRCQGPQGMERRAVYRCLNDACGHVYHGKRMIVGAEPSESSDPGQNVPVPFVTHEDRELAAGPHYRAVSEAGDAPPASADLPIPPPAPLPPAPPSHRIYWSRPEHRERRAAGSDR